MLSGSAHPRARCLLLMAACLLPSLAGAQHQSSYPDSTPITCDDGLYLIYTGYTHSCNDRDFFSGRSAGDSQAWRELWDEYVGVLNPPPVDFDRYVVVSFVKGYDQDRHRKVALRGTAILRDGTLVFDFYAEAARVTGPLVEREPTILLNTVWFMAIPRSRLGGLAAPRRVVAAEPWLEVNDYPREFNPLETRPPDERCYLPRLTPRQFRAQLLEKGEFVYWRDRTHWEASVGLFGGLGTKWSRLFGGEATFGVSRSLRFDSSNWNTWLGDEWGLELHGWFGVAAAPAQERSILAGIRPWTARADTSSSDWLGTKRHPTLLGSVIPEFGMLLQQRNPITAYVAWSAPFLWHRSQFYYRTTPYVLREHSAFEVRPGLLWLLSANSTNVLVTLSVGYRLW